MNKKSFLICSTLIVFYAVASMAFGADTTLTYPSFVSSTSPADFVVNFYNFALGIAGTLAIIEIIYGGIKYIVSAGNSSAQTDAKDIIMSSIWGILLLAGAFLVLNTINPTLTQIKNPESTYVPSVTTGGAPNNPGNPSFTSSCPTGLDSNLCLQEVSMEKNLQSFGISISSTGNCDDPTNSNCTSLYGFPQSGLDALVNLKSDCGCSINVTAGTETGHVEHGPGKEVVDLSNSPLLDSYIEGQIGNNSPPLNTDFAGADGNSYRKENGAGGPHWHVRFDSSKHS